MLLARKSAEPAEFAAPIEPRVYPKGIERATFAIFAIYVALCALIVLLVTQALHSAEQFANRSSDARATAIARSYANYLSERTAAADLLARAVAYQYRDRHGAVDLTRLVAAGLLVPADQTLVTLVDANGLVRQAWPTAPEAPVYLGDREHFVAQQNAKRDDVYIGVAVRGRVSKRPTLQFTRKLLDADGKFSGVVVVSEPLSFFTKSFANPANLGADGAVFAFRQDGQLLVRASSDGKPTQDGASLDRYVASDDSTAFAFDPVDHQRRLYARQAVPGYPITVLVALSAHDVYADLERQKNAYWGWAFLVVLALTAAAFLAKSYVRTLLVQRAVNARIAETDPLTGLGNRRALDAYTMDLFRQDPRPPVALVIFEINDFAVINQRYGDDVGDGFLRMVANRLTQLTASAALVVRLKTEQFGILLPGDEPSARALAFVRSLFESYGFPVHFRGYSQDVTLSVGIGTSEYDDSPAGLRSQASYALDLAKRAAAETRQNEYRVYDRGMFEQFAGERRIDDAVHEAASHGGIEAACTPVVDVRKNSITALWAEPRIRRANGDVLEANAFMDAADRARLSNAVWLLTISHAAKVVARFSDDALLWTQVSANFIRDIEPERYLAPAILEPRRLRLAVTGLLERRLDKMTAERINSLRELGIAVYAVVDLDGGVPLPRLTELPIDGLVIAGSWIHALPASSIATSIVGGFIEAADRSGWQMMVSGIRTQEQLAWLRTTSVGLLAGPYVGATWPVTPRLD
ncbi:diguanylate cyclase [Burkholderia cepacia]|uniref:diguanylate cyclase domain-containing protein n=1 Tax=Burkholderia cepacia TaxID=292 RepID=UPI002654E60C|nr:diguanylate cyclase [Burkholderia cepacia]MDN7900824.1 diguanylate cyclase [Burkholderia cepacia]